MTSPPRAAPRDRTHLGLMLALTFGSGVVDAVSYLALDQVFTANMTGNVLILGMALAGGADLQLLGPLLALAGFMAGAALAGRVLRRTDDAWTGRTTALVALVGSVLLVIAAALLVTGNDPPRSLVLTVTPVLAIVMGVQTATARHIAVPDVTTVVVTSTIAGLAAESALGSGRATRTGRRIAAVLLLLAGAAAGTGLLRWHLGAAPVLAGAIVLTVAALGARHERNAASRPAAAGP
ncbi:YoaK family protein [Nocardioides pantholopis]|uniref:YoaK family protein n=1 Tax=Nocardioides pantholopis TaxID=2483798 RepID=UPI001F49FAFF|nr:YoaK family protein [Nocardioides pantholopis]